MSLDALTDVGNNRPPQTIEINGRQAKFLFGMEYMRTTPTYKSLFELVYENPRMDVIDRAIVDLLRSVGYEDSQNSDSGVPYVLNTHSLEELHSKNAIEPKRDYRYILFGSRAIYKSFFKVLNEKRASVSINKEDYQEVYDRIQLLFDRLHNKIKLTNNPFIIIDSIKRAIKEFEQDEVITPYLEEAKLRVPYKLH